MIYTHNLSPIAFSILGLEVRWYGLMYVFGFLIIQYLGWYLWQKFNHLDQTRPKQLLNFTKKDFENLIFWVFLFGVLGGRIGFFLFYNPQTLLQNPLQFFKVWEGGMSIHGGFLFGFLAFLYLTRQYKLPTLQTADIFVLPMSIGLFFGRIANFINAELVGHPTNGNWGIIFPNVDNALRHPSQLYHASKDLILASILCLIIYKSGFRHPGLLTAVFLIGYGSLRFFVEFFRVPDLMVGPLSMGQTLCIIMMTLGVSLIFKIIKKTKLK